MKKFTITTSIFGALAATALGLAGAAAAVPTGSSAADTVSSLQAQGQNVQLNGRQPPRCRSAGYRCPAIRQAGLTRHNSPPSTSTFPARRQIN